MEKTRKAGLVLVFVTVFIDLLGFGIVLPLLPRYGRHFQASPFELGLLMASFSAMQFLFAPFWGRLSDRIGRRPVLLIGLAGSALFYSLFGVATSLGRTGVMLGFSALTWLFITRIGAGIAGATIATAQAYIADSTSAKNRGKGMALIGAAFGIGFTFGPLLGAAFVSATPTIGVNPDQMQYVENADTDLSGTPDALIRQLQSRGPVARSDREAIAAIYSGNSTAAERRHALGAPPSAAPGYVAAVLSGVALLFAIVFLPESRKPDSQPARVQWLNFASLTATLRRPIVGRLLLTIFLTTFAFAQFESTLSLLTEDLGLSDRHNFFVFAYIGLVLTIAQGGLVRRLVPKLGEQKMATLGVIGMTIGLILIGLVPAIGGSIGLLYLVLPVAVIGFSAVTPSLQSMLSLRTPDGEQGEVLGIGQSLSSLARILGPMLGLSLTASSTILPYFAGAGLMLIGVFLVMSLPSRTAPATE